MQKAVRLGIDVGKARIGVARTDVQGTLAMPVETIKRDQNAVNRISQLVKDYEAAVIYIGLPISLSGTITASTQDAIDFAVELKKHIFIPIFLVDERLSTVSAISSLQAAGHNSKSTKAIIDQAAAVVILEQALNIERSTNNWAGKALSD